jgi:hypothetical protein
VTMAAGRPMAGSRQWYRRRTRKRGGHDTQKQDREKFLADPHHVILDVTKKEMV